MILTRAQIASLAKLAGFPDSEIPTAVAIALAESSGNTRAYNPEIAKNTVPAFGSYGLWQIYLQDHPEFSARELEEPLSQAFAAYDVWRKAGGSWAPWATYGSGAYRRYLE